MRHFGELIKAQWNSGKFLCVGLDPDVEKIPEKFKTGSVGETLIAFNQYIIDETRDVAAAYKPNSAFYEAYGAEGVAALKETVAYANTVAGEVPVILDAKRGDLENTNRSYVRAVFEVAGVDAVTVHPYLGSESLEPFLERGDKGVIVMCRNSNPGAGEFQDVVVNGMPMYQYMATRVAAWNTRGNCWIVVGATYPEEMAKVRTLVPDLPFLVPGVGAQGGDLEAAVRAAKDAHCKGFVIATSRTIIYADSPRAEAQKLHSAIQQALLQ